MLDNHTPDSQVTRVLTACLTLTQWPEAAAPELRLALVNVLLRLALGKRVRAYEVHGLFGLLQYQVERGEKAA